MSMIKNIRDALIDWAYQNGVLQGAIQPLNVDKSLVPFPDDFIEFFRTRKIIRISIDEKSQTITIFSRLVVAKTKVKKLVDEFDHKYSDDNIRLKVDVSKPFKVDQKLESYGKFDPIHQVNGKYACGSSIGIGNQRNAGTLTALGLCEGDLIGISCNHVIGGCSTSRPGTPIVVPGIQDVSPEFNEMSVIGYHNTTAPMSQGLPSMIDYKKNCDLAIFTIKQPELMTSYQGKGDLKYDTPTQFAKIKPRMFVKKWGRSTGLTKGYISNVIRDGDESVDYNVISYFGPMNSQVFKGTIYYDTIYEVTSASGSPFSLGGDSGALVVSNEVGKQEKIIGIIIGGSKEKTIVLPIVQALEVLKVKLVNKHNV